MPTETCNRVRVEKYFLGEGGKEDKRETRLHLDGCADCRALVSKLENERRDYLMIHPFREFAGKKLPVEKSPRAAGLPRWLPALAAVVACLVLLPLLPFMADRFDAAQSAKEKGLRAKGGPILEFYCKRDGVVKPGQASDAYRAGDELQFVYGGQGYTYVTLASIDTRGTISLYRAEGESLAVSQEAKPGDRQTLPFGVTLDNSPGSELFVLVYSSKALTGAAVESWLHGAFIRASENLEAMAATLMPPPALPSALPNGQGVDPHSAVKGLLLRKTKA